MKVEAIGDDKRHILDVDVDSKHDRVQPVLLPKHCKRNTLLSCDYLDEAKN